MRTAGRTRSEFEVQLATSSLEPRMPQRHLGNPLGTHCMDRIHRLVYGCYQHGQYARTEAPEALSGTDPAVGLVAASHEGPATRTPGVFIAPC